MSIKFQRDTRMHMPHCEKCAAEEEELRAKVERLQYANKCLQDDVNRLLAYNEELFAGDTRLKNIREAIRRHERAELEQKIGRLGTLIGQLLIDVANAAEGKLTTERMNELTELSNTILLAAEKPDDTPIQMKVKP